MTPRQPLLPYWPSIALWLVGGPLGLGALASGRWERSVAQSLLWAAGLWTFQDGWRALMSGGLRALARGIADGSLSGGLAAAATTMLATSLGIWGGDLWRMGSWHGRLSDPLLDPRLHAPQRKDESQIP